MFERVTWKECAIARQRAASIIHDVQIILRDKYIFDPHLVGSGAWGTMIKDDKGEYDLDYQLILTINSPEYKKNRFNNPTQIKNDFYNAFVEVSKKYETIENSTTAVTLITKDHKPFHIDFVIIKEDDNYNHQIIRRNNKAHSSINEYTWNQLPKFNDAYYFFNLLTPQEKQYLIEQIIIPKKIIEKKKSDNDPSKISSSALFIREVNNYANRKRNR